MHQTAGDRMTISAALGQQPIPSIGHRAQDYSNHSVAKKVKKAAGHDYPCRNT